MGGWQIPLCVISEPSLECWNHTFCTSSHPPFDFSCAIRHRRSVKKHTQIHTLNEMILFLQSHLPRIQPQIRLWIVSDELCLLHSEGAPAASQDCTNDSWLNQTGSASCWTPVLHLTQSTADQRMTERFKDPKNHYNLHWKPLMLVSMCQRRLPLSDIWSSVGDES